MKVKCIKDYYDIELKKTVVKDTEFEVADARGKALISHNNKAGHPLCEEVTTTTPEKVVKQRPKKKEA